VFSVEDHSHLFVDSKCGKDPATMGEEMLCGLAMLHVHRHMNSNVSKENIRRRFDETGHRNIGTLRFE